MGDGGRRKNSKGKLSNRETGRAESVPEQGGGRVRPSWHQPESEKQTHAPRVRHQGQEGQPQQHSRLWAFRQAQDRSGVHCPLKDTHTKKGASERTEHGNKEPFASQHPLGMSHLPHSPVTSVPKITPSTSIFKTLIAIKMSLHVNPTQTPPDMRRTYSRQWCPRATETFCSCGTLQSHRSKVIKR